MSTRFRHASLLAFSLLLLALSTVRPTRALAARFTVLDDKAEEEIGEITRLYVDGVLVADFHLGDGQVHKRIDVSVPDTEGKTLHRYALCGEIEVQASNGARLVRQVSGQGILPAPDGHTFLAVGANDFTRFFLIDPADRTATMPDPQPSPFCQAPIS